MTERHDGQRLRYVRQRLGWSQAELGKRWQVRQATISAWEQRADLPGHVCDAVAWLHVMLAETKHPGFTSRI